MAAPVAFASRWAARNRRAESLIWPAVTVDPSRRTNPFDHARGRRRTGPDTQMQLRALAAQGAEIATLTD